MNEQRWAKLIRMYPVSAAALAVMAVVLVVVGIVTTLPADDAAGAGDQVAAPTATAAPTTDATVGATESATAVAATPATPTRSPEEDALALGQQLWTKDAGGVGCQFCHGPAGRGGGVSGEGAPYIRGATKSMIRGALAGGVPLMGFIQLTESELTAVSKYLDYLTANP